MSYRFLEDVAIADACFEVDADSLPDLFRDGSVALLDLQIDEPSSVQTRTRRSVELKHADLDLLFYRFLQELIYLKDAKKLLLRGTDLAVGKEGDEWVLRGELEGESLDPARHAQRADAKAATLHLLDVWEAEGRWHARAVVDI